MIAERLGMRPARASGCGTCSTTATRVMTGEPMDDAHFRELLDRRGERIGWDSRRRRRSRRRRARSAAKGLSCIIKGTVTPSTSTAAVKLNDDGSLQRPDQLGRDGPGAPDRAGDPRRRARSACPSSGCTSRSAGHRRHAVRPADQLQPLDHAMGTAVVGRRRRDPGSSCSSWRPSCSRSRRRPRARRRQGPASRARRTRALDFGELVRRDARAATSWAAATFQTDGGLDPETGQGIGRVHWHQAAGAAEVEVDLETGKVDVLRYHAAVYAGPDRSTRSRRSCRPRATSRSGSARRCSRRWSSTTASSRTATWATT